MILLHIIQKLRSAEPRPPGSLLSVSWISTDMNRCASGYGNGSIRMLSITLKIAVDAPIPSARVIMATMANPGVFPRFLSAYRISCPSVPMSISLFPRIRFVRHRRGGSLDPFFPNLAVTVLSLVRHPHSSYAFLSNKFDAATLKKLPIFPDTPPPVPPPPPFDDCHSERGEESALPVLN